MVSRLQLCQKLYDFMYWYLPIIARFPKSQHHLIGKNICDLCFNLLDVIIQANQSFGQERQQLQKRVSQKFDSLRLSTRLSKDLHLISIKQYVQATDKINEMGRMLQAWKSK